MACRITWRSRPRADFPYAYGCADKNVADIPEPRIGPFSFDAIVELLFRVKDTRAQGSFYTQPPESELVDVDATKTSDYADEARQFQMAMYFPEDTSYWFVPVADEPIYKDENGEYWIRATVDNDDVRINRNVRESVDDIEFDCSLVLNCGTFPVKFYSSGVTPNLTITATAWWPYATKSGDPAWDTATGDPINGGPGA